MTPPRHSLWLVRLRILLAAVTPGRSLFKSGVAFNLAVPIVLSPSICRPFAPRAPRTSYLPCDHLGSHLLWVGRTRTRVSLHYAGGLRIPRLHS